MLLSGGQGADVPDAATSTEDTTSASAVGEGAAPVATTASNGDSAAGDTDGAPVATGPKQENGVAEAEVKMENNSASDAHKVNNGSGNSNGIAETGGGDDKEPNGEAAKMTEEEGAVKEDEDMEIEPPPKPDVMVDYTDEFGRVRTMLQRCGNQAMCMSFTIYQIHCNELSWWYSSTHTRNPK